MTKRQFILCVGVLALLAGIAFLVRDASIRARATEIQRANIEAERARMIQEAKTERTQERWDALQRVPLLRKVNPKHQTKETP